MKNKLLLSLLFVGFSTQPCFAAEEAAVEKVDDVRSGEGSGSGSGGDMGATFFSATGDRLDSSDSEGSISASSGEPSGHREAGWHDGERIKVNSKLYVPQERMHASEENRKKHKERARKEHARSQRRKEERDAAQKSAAELGARILALEEQITSASDSSSATAIQLEELRKQLATAEAAQSEFHTALVKSDKARTEAEQRAKKAAEDASARVTEESNRYKATIAQAQQRANDAEAAKKALEERLSLLEGLDADDAEGSERERSNSISGKACDIQKLLVTEPLEPKKRNERDARIIKLAGQIDAQRKVNKKDTARREEELATARETAIATAGARERIIAEKDTELERERTKNTKLGEEISATNEAASTAQENARRASKKLGAARAQVETLTTQLKTERTEKEAALAEAEEAKDAQKRAEQTLREAIEEATQLTRKDTEQRREELETQDTGDGEEEEEEEEEDAVVVSTEDASGAHAQEDFTPGADVLAAAAAAKETDDSSSEGESLAGAAWRIGRGLFAGSSSKQTPSKKDAAAAETEEGARSGSRSESDGDDDGESSSGGARLVHKSRESRRQLASNPAGGALRQAQDERKEDTAKDGGGEGGSERGKPRRRRRSSSSSSSGDRLAFALGKSALVAAQNVFGWLRGPNADELIDAIVAGELNIKDLPLQQLQTICADPKTQEVWGTFVDTGILVNEGGDGAAPRIRLADGIATESMSEDQKQFVARFLVSHRGLRQGIRVAKRNRGKNSNSDGWDAAHTDLKKDLKLAELLVPLIGDSGALSDHEEDALEFDAYQRYHQDPSTNGAVRRIGDASSSSERR